MLAEVKAMVVNWTARTIIESVVPQVDLHVMKTSSLKKAADLDRKEGNFKRSADNYFTELQTNSHDGERAEALIGLVQQLINLGDFHQARQWLGYGQVSLALLLEGNQKQIFEARLCEKLGWVEDYELGFERARQAFVNCSDLISEIPNWIEDMRSLYSTTRHFLGRAHLGLASLGIDRFDNLAYSEQYFRQAIELDSEIRDDGTDGKLGFGHSWLARCYIMTRSSTQAYHEVSQAGHHFVNQMLVTDRKGYQAQWDLIRGLYELTFGNLDSAYAYFSNAALIRSQDPPEGEPYPKGLADAYLGLSKVNWEMGYPLDAARYLKKAVVTHPYAALRGVVIGA